jgi:hypothetical protein
MTKDILSEYGPDSPADQKPRASNGGVMPVRDVRNYSPPQGPSGIMHEGIGLGGSNTGHGQRHSSGDRAGSPGLHGTNHGNCGSQGRR